ncbi:hypothetical protein THRCLA_07346 [Thraustotheca clavata]|uniref:Uncharacterized protein n=1 Tax=Thraustotheca clavata TaxID=74557 RepID=A0A1V9ZDW2_9STRA|nr:hypothetical protein THRCLA_07346 [Thraustotheca clavata]
MIKKVYLEVESQEKWKLPQIVQSDSEIRCCHCGQTHPKLELVETYRYCSNCRKILRPSSALEVESPLNQLYILAASYGHPIDAAGAIDVTSEIRSCLQITTRVLSSSIHLEFYTDRIPKLWILNGKYGHRNSNSESMKFDVTERMTGLVDQQGGCYLCIPTDLDLEVLLGDPCPGISKALVVNYEICGRSGQARQYEVDGHLKEDISIQHLPLIAPAILIERALYGWPPKELQLKIVDLQAQLALGQDVKEQLEQFNAFAASKTTFNDIAPRLQRRIDHHPIAGSKLELSETTNLNQLCGDPCPGLPKLLLIEYKLLGFGSSSNDNEVLNGGHIRNFAMRKAGKYKLQVTLEGFLASPITIQPLEISPALQIVRAFFGHPTNALKTFDITEAIGTMAAKSSLDKTLVVPRTLDLVAKFGDPCRGIRKALTINYKVLGMAGELVIPSCESNHLSATLVLGYPRDKKDGGVHGKVSWTERVAMSPLKTKQTARERMQSSTSLRIWSNDR